VERDGEVAITWFRKAALQAYAPAEAALGQMYLSGEDVRADVKEGLKWYRKAAKTGNAAAELALGVAYLHGNGVQEDERQAMQWLQKAARHGSIPAAGLLKTQMVTSGSESEVAAAPLSRENRGSRSTLLDQR
jgi:hypothetical protein